MMGGKIKNFNVSQVVVFNIIPNLSFTCTEYITITMKTFCNILKCNTKLPRKNLRMFKNELNYRHVYYTMKTLVSM